MQDLDSSKCSMAWNIREFRSLAEQILSPNSLAALELPLRSIPWKFALCRYHASEVHRILAEPFDQEQEYPIAEAIGKVLKRAAGTEEGRAFADACFRAEAHMIAFAQSLHSTADILAQVLCTALSLDPLFGPRERRRYLAVVVKTMEAHGVAPSVAQAVRQFLNCDEFCYLRMYVNTTKHYSLVPSGYSVHLVPGQERHSLKISVFNNQSDSMPEKWAPDFVGTDFERLSELFGAVGSELNIHLSTLAAGSA